MCALTSLFKAGHFPEESILVNYKMRFNLKNEAWGDFEADIQAVGDLLGACSKKLTIFTNGLGLLALINLVRDCIVDPYSVKKLVIVSPSSACRVSDIRALTTKATSFTLVVPTLLVAGRLGNNVKGDVFREENFKNWFFANGTRLVVELPRALRVRVGDGAKFNISLQTLRNIIGLARFCSPHFKSAPPGQEWAIVFNDSRTSTEIITKNIETYGTRMFVWT